MRVFCILFVILKVTGTLHTMAGIHEAYDGLSEYFSEVTLGITPAGCCDGYEMRDITAVIIDPEKFLTGCHKAAIKISNGDEFFRAKAIEHYWGDCKIKGNQCLGHTKPGAVTDSYSNSTADDDNLEACPDNSKMNFFSHADYVDGHDCYSIILGGHVEELMDQKFPGLKDNILTWLVILLDQELKVQKNATVSLGPMGKKLPLYFNKVM